MTTPWYMPKDTTIWLVNGEGGDPRYVRWFDTRKAALSYGNWRRGRNHDERLTPPVRLTWRSKTREWFGLDRPVGWILFDASNGDTLSKRYCWLFYTRKEARTQLLKHRAMQSYARLVGPFQVGY